MVSICAGLLGRSEFVLMKKKLASLFVALFSLVWLTGAGWLPLARTGGGCSPVLILDCITTGIKASYSTRKLLTAYAGNAIRVQRTSDNAQQDIGFVSNVLDTTTLATFCSGTDGKVITWYDQSGGGHDLTQAAATAPWIFRVSGGGSGQSFINTTRPALDFFNGATVLTNATLAQNPVNTLFLNAVATDVGAAENALVGGTVANNLYWRDDITTLTASLLAAATSVIATATTAQTSTGSVIESQYNSSTGTTSFWVDGAAAGTATNAKTFAGGGTILVGQDTASSAGNNEKLGELIMYDLVGGIPSGSRTTIEANQKAYWGTP